MALLHRWLRSGERILWHAMANRGREGARPVGGRLFVTDQRLYFRPAAFERFAEEEPWQAPAAAAEVTVGRGPWHPKLPLLRPIALRFRVRVEVPDRPPEDFRLARVGAPLRALAGPDEIPEAHGGAS